MSQKVLANFQTVVSGRIIGGMTNGKQILRLKSCRYLATCDRSSENLILRVPIVGAVIHTVGTGNPRQTQVVWLCYGPLPLE